MRRGWWDLSIDLQCIIANKQTSAKQPSKKQKQTSKHLHWLLMTQQKPSLDYKAQCRRCKPNLSGESISIFCLEKCITALNLVPPYPLLAIRIIKGVTEEVFLNGAVSDIHRVFKVVLLGNSAPCAGRTVDLWAKLELGTLILLRVAGVAPD